MIYTEEDIQKAYAMGYNEAVDDVNNYIDQESMDYNLDDEMDNYNEDYSAVEDMIFSETSRANKIKHDRAIRNEIEKKNTNGTVYRGVHAKNLDRSSMLLRAQQRKNGMEDNRAESPYYHPQVNDNIKRHTPTQVKYAMNRFKIFGSK